MSVLEFSDDRNVRLLGRGLHISAMRKTEIGYGLTTFEPPCVIDATIFFDTVVAVGAFSAMYGGHLRHCRIGRYCSIAPGVQFGWDAHPSSFITSSMSAYVENVHGWRQFVGAPERTQKDDLPHFQSIKGITEVGHDVWIGHGAFIMPGVKIGTGAIVGASSVVTKDIPSYQIWAGNPARLVKSRFEPELVESLLRSEWWRYSIFDLPRLLLSRPYDLLQWLESVARGSAIAPYSPEVITEIDMERILND